MQDNTKRSISSTIEKEIYSFLQNQGPQSLPLPPALHPHSQSFALVVLAYLIPMMQEVDIAVRQKGTVADILEVMLVKYQQYLSQLGVVHARCGEEQMQSSASKMSFCGCLTKYVTLPNHYLNLISDGLLSQQRQVSIANLQKYKQQLYRAVLQTASGLAVQQQLLLVNKLIVLGYHQLVLEHFQSIEEGQFILKYFDQLSKPKNLVARLYAQLVQSSKEQVEATSQSKKLTLLLTALANFHTDVTVTGLLSLLNTSYTQLFAGNRFRLYFQLVAQTKAREKVLLELLKWWSVGKNYILTEIHAQIRCNILCLFLQNMGKEELLASDYTACVVEGIKKRLTDGSSKQFALLVWKTMAEVGDLPSTPEVQQSQLFTITAHNQIKTEKNSPIQKSTENKKYDIREDKAFQSQREEVKEMKDESDSSGNDLQDGTIRIEPKNIYDCILGLRNPQRVKVVLQKLPQIIASHKEDLILMWGSLLETLLRPLQEQYQHVLVLLFKLKPEEFIDSVSCYFLGRQTNVSEKIWLMAVINKGIEALATSQPQEQESEEPEFYFKKVRSRYFAGEIKEVKKREEEREQQREKRTRRWGHTRIAHEQKNKGVSLNIVNNTQINRFCPISNLLYYKVIEVLSLDLVASLRQHQILAHNLLRLLSTFTSLIKNHFQKYMLLFDISSVCLRVVEELLEAKSKGSNRYQESGGQTLMLCLQVVYKISLVLDRFASQTVMTNLRKVIEGSRKLPNYGMSAILSMIEGNIYQAVYQHLSLEGV